MDIYEEYQSFINEHFELISTLVRQKSKIISRFSHVFLVLDHINNLKTKDQTDKDLDLIFETAYDYFSVHIDTISNILKDKFNNDMFKMNEIEKTINLLLYIHDFEYEVMNLDGYNQQAYDELLKIEEMTLTLIDNKKVVSDSLFVKLNEVTEELFTGDYYDVNSILYDIALELGLIEYNDPFENMDLIFGEVNAQD